MRFLCLLKEFFQSKPQSKNVSRSDSDETQVAGAQVSTPDLAETDLELRPAQPTDEDFVYSLIEIEARAGHFNPDFLNPMASRGLREQISQTIKEGVMAIGEGAFKAAALHVLSTSDNQIGFAWLTKSEHRGIKGWEIYMCAVQSSVRGKGFGKSLVERSLGLANTHQPVLARVYAKSSAMGHILISFGFQTRGSTDSSTLYVLSRKR